MSSGRADIATPGPRADRRNARAHNAIIKSTLKLLRTVRYSSLTIEAIASKAGVGKATVYRWWPSKGALVAEAISTSLRVEDPPEQGDFRADLIAAVEVSVANYAHPASGVLVVALAADLIDDPALRSSFLEDFVLPRRHIVSDLIARGIEDGHIRKHTDPELLMDMWAGAVIYRVLMKHLPLTDDFAAQLVDAVLVKPSRATATKRSNPSGPPSRRLASSSGARR